MNGVFENLTTPTHFSESFRLAGRGDQYTCEAFDVLYDYLTDLSESCDEPIIMDVIGLCCEWTEYETIQELAEAYGHEDDLGLGLDMNDHGTVLVTQSGTFLFSE